MKQSCKNCKFYKENYMAESCYRYPKKINTYYKHWCGEWSKKEFNKVVKENILEHKKC